MLSLKTILIIFFLMIFSGCDREQTAWDSAVNSNTPSAYGAYLDKYKHGAHSDEAKLRLEELKEKEDWELAVNSNTSSAYGAYLDKYKHGAHLDESKLRFEELKEDEDWDYAKNAYYYGIALKKFISDHPNTRHLTEIDILLLSGDTKRLLALRNGFWRSSPAYDPDGRGNTSVYFTEGSTIRLHDVSIINPIVDEKGLELAAFGSVKVIGVAIKSATLRTNEKGITHIFALMKVSVLVNGETVMLLYFNLSDKDTELAHDYTHWAVVKGKKYCIPSKETVWRAEDTSNGVCVGSFESENSQRSPDGAQRNPG